MALLDFSCSAKLMVCLRSRAELDNGRSGCILRKPIEATALAMAAATLCGEGGCRDGGGWGVRGVVRKRVERAVW